MTAKELRDWLTALDGKTHGGVVEASYIIDGYVKIAHEAVAALEERGWISVTERLPKKSGYYLILRKENVFPTTRYYHFPGDRWESSATITHWMPLPEPPDTEETNHEWGEAGMSVKRFSVMMDNTECPIRVDQDNREWTHDEHEDLVPAETYDDLRTASEKMAEAVESAIWMLEHRGVPDVNDLRPALTDFRKQFPNEESNG